MNVITQGKITVTRPLELYTQHTGSPPLLWRCIRSAFFFPALSRPHSSSPCAPLSTQATANAAHGRGEVSQRSEARARSVRGERHINKRHHKDILGPPRRY
jgi:hypothetical protein